MIITSSGIIKNEEFPRVGIIALNSLYDGFYEEHILNGRDLSFDSAIEELTAELTGANKSEDEIEEAKEELSQNWESDSDQYLIGDWMENDFGEYVINPDGENGWSGQFSGNSQNISVEYSRIIVRCMHTSPCYVMSDGSGPCGDLNHLDDSGTVLAYSLPADMFRVAE